MRVAVFGLGYVGSVSAACLAQDGHRVVGVDTSRAKVAMINRGQAPIIEAELSGLIQTAVESGQLRAVTSASEAVEAADVSVICVGTPSLTTGGLDLQYVSRVCSEIGTALNDKREYHVVVVRSTMLPGSMRGVVIPALQSASGKHAGTDFGVCYNPEFLREGTAVLDYRTPPLVMIGGSDMRANQVAERLYDGSGAQVVHTDLEVAEMLKYASNAWHAVKVTFANEIGAICRAAHVDSHKVMDAFCVDTKLNISRAYLKPGFAYGGSCLPKDVRALGALGRKYDLSLPLLYSVAPSNEQQIERAWELVLESGNGPVGVIGLSFKAGTDDLRESPTVALVERLLGKGRTVRVYDRHVQAARLSGSNREYIDNHIPHIARLLCDTAEDLITASNVIVVASADPALRGALETVKQNCTVVDLVRAAQGLGRPGRYYGFSW